MLTFCTQIGFMRFFGRIKPTNNGVRSVSANPSTPFFTTFQFRNTKKPTSFISGMCSFLVLNITRSGYISKVGKSIIARVAINVVNVVKRLLTRYIKPSKTTSGVTYFVDTNNRISFRLHVPGNSSRNNFATSFYFPSKNTCFGIVVQNSTQLSKCDFGHALSIL